MYLFPLSLLFLNFNFFLLISILSFGYHKNTDIKENYQNKGFKKNNIKILNIRHLCHPIEVSKPNQFSMINLLYFISFMAYMLVVFYSIYILISNFCQPLHKISLQIKVLFLGQNRHFHEEMKVCTVFHLKKVIQCGFKCQIWNLCVLKSCGYDFEKNPKNFSWRIFEVKKKISQKSPKNPIFIYKNGLFESVHGFSPQKRNQMWF